MGQLYGRVVREFCLPPLFEPFPNNRPPSPYHSSIASLELTPSTVKIKLARFPATSLTNYEPTRCRIPEDIHSAWWGLRTQKCVLVCDFVSRFIDNIKVKGKEIPLQALPGPESCRILRLPDFKKIST
jgi:hypothetical protein